MNRQKNGQDVLSPGLMLLGGKHIKIKRIDAIIPTRAYYHNFNLLSRTFYILCDLIDISSLKLCHHAYQ